MARRKTTKGTKQVSREPRRVAVNVVKLEEKVEELEKRVSSLEKKGKK